MVEAAPSQGPGPGKEFYIRPWIIGLGIAGSVLALLALCGLLGWRAFRRYFVRRYYKASCHPLQLSPTSPGSYPEEYHLDDVPWISSEEAVCQSTSLQMIAAQHGIHQPRPYFDFLMGFTYGTGRIPGGLGFYPGTDPEPGFLMAAPYLGLVRRYYVTDDPLLYLNALRYHISQGTPARVGLDMAALYDGLEAGIPHSEVFVGYDAAGFRYYETVCLPEAPCEPGHRAPGEVGLFLADERLLEAVLGQAQLFHYPWRYSYSVFEPGPLEQDLGPVWVRNGQSLIGGAKYGPRQGADVLDGLASEVEMRSAKVDAAEIRPGLKTAAYVRQENAMYLREAFPGEIDLEKAVSLFDLASASYRTVLATLEDGIADRTEACEVASQLRAAADAERAAGAILLARGRPTSTI